MQEAGRVLEGRQQAGLPEDNLCSPEWCLSTPGPGEKHHGVQQDFVPTNGQSSVTLRQGAGLTVIILQWGPHRGIRSAYFYRPHMFYALRDKGAL